jgi:flavin reductase (NADH)
MGPRILIADAHRGARENLRRLLGRISDLAVAGVAASAPEALAQARALAPDLVLLDAGLLDAGLLDGGPGTDLLASLAALPRPPRVVLVTAPGREMDERRARALGAAGAVSPLASRDSLLAAVRRVLAAEPEDVPTAPGPTPAPPAPPAPPATSTRVPTPPAPGVPSVAAPTPGTAPSEARTPPEDEPPPIARGFALSLGGGAHDLAVATDEAHAQRFREALARWPSGVTVVTTRETTREAADPARSTSPTSPTSPPGAILGITVSAFCALSLDPPLILLAIGEGQPILPALLRGRFTVNILGAEQADLADFYARRADRRAARPVEPAFVEDEILAGSRAALGCALWREYPGGDHRILLGLVERVWLGPPEDPLLHARRAYRRVGGAAPSGGR